jgi:hypothetical protein
MYIGWLFRPKYTLGSWRERSEQNGRLFQPGLLTSLSFFLSFFLSSVLFVRTLYHDHVGVNKALGGKKNIF